MWKWGAAALGVVVIAVSGYLIMQQPSEEYKGSVGNKGTIGGLDISKLGVSRDLGGLPGTAGMVPPDATTPPAETPPPALVGDAGLPGVTDQRGTITVPLTGASGTAGTGGATGAAVTGVAGTSGILDTGGLAGAGLAGTASGTTVNKGDANIGKIAEDSEQFGRLSGIRGGGLLGGAGTVPPDANTPPENTPPPAIVGNSGLPNNNAVSTLAATSGLAGLEGRTGAAAAGALRTGGLGGSILLPGSNQSEIDHKACNQKMADEPGVWEWDGSTCGNLTQKFAKDCIAEGAAAEGGKCILEGIGAFNSIDALRGARGTYQACIAQGNKQWNGIQMACEDKPIEVAVNIGDEPEVEGEPGNVDDAPAAIVSSIGEERTVTGRPTGTQTVTVNPSGSASSSGVAPGAGSSGSTGSTGGGGQSLAPSTGSENATVTAPATKPIAVKVKPKTGNSSASTNAQANAAGASNAEASANSTDAATAAASASGAAASASIAKKVHGAFIQGETGPGLLLYPAFIAGANGLFYLARKRKRLQK